jgi:hypothetical protein
VDADRVEAAKQRVNTSAIRWFLAWSSVIVMAGCSCSFFIRRRAAFHVLDRIQREKPGGDLVP